MLKISWFADIKGIFLFFVCFVFQNSRQFYIMEQSVWQVWLLCGLLNFSIFSFCAYKWNPSTHWFQEPCPSFCMGAQDGNQNLACLGKLCFQYSLWYPEEIAWPISNNNTSTWPVSNTWLIAKLLWALMHRYHRGHELKSCWSLRFFLGFLWNCSSCFTTACKDHFHLIYKHILLYLAIKGRHLTMTYTVGVSQRYTHAISNLKLVLMSISQCAPGIMRVFGFAR